MKKFIRGGIGVAILLFLSITTISCNTNIPTPQEKIEKQLVEVNNKIETLREVKILKQFDSLCVVINKKQNIIDSLLFNKPAIVETKSKFSDKQIDSIIQSNKNLNNAIKHQNTIIKNLQKAK